jgi:hypothetical protein
MSSVFSGSMCLPPEQEAIRAKCFHPSGDFAPFLDLALDSSVPHRFQEIARKYPDSVTIETATENVTFRELLSSPEFRDYAAAA